MVMPTEPEVFAAMDRDLWRRGLDEEVGVWRGDETGTVEDECSARRVVWESKS